MNYSKWVIGWKCLNSAQMGMWLILPYIPSKFRIGIKPFPLSLRISSLNLRLKTGEECLKVVADALNDRSILIRQAFVFAMKKWLRNLNPLSWSNLIWETKLADIEAENASQNLDMQALVNGRRLTNIGVFRAYIEAYLKNHPMIHPDLTFLIRQLAPNEKGLSDRDLCFYQCDGLDCLRSDSGRYFWSPAGRVDGVWITDISKPDGQEFWGVRKIKVSRFMGVFKWAGADLPERAD